MVGVALELLSTLVDILGIDIPKDLPNNQETVRPSNDFTFRGMVDWVWARMQGGCGLMEIICPNGLKDDVSPGLGDDAIRLGPKAQKGLGYFWPVR